MQAKATPGIIERHSRACASRTGAQCSCEPSYQAWVWLPREGKKKRKTFSGKGAKSAAKNWLADARKPAREGRLRVGDDRIRVDAWLTKWLDERAPQDASPRVVALYRTNLETHVIPELGHLRLVNLRRSDCNALVGTLFGKSLAKNTIKNILTPLRLALAHAVDEEKLAGNPAAGLKIPKGAPTRKLHVPTLEEVKRILAKCDDDGRDAIELDASLGLRRSELLALRWCDVDFERNLVHIRQKNVAGVIEAGAKTEAGSRRAPLYASARATLAARVERKGLQLQWLKTDERLIFATAHGGPLHPRNFSRRVWEKAREDAGLTDVRLHDLRHFAASALRDQGMDNKLRSTTIGHADEKITDTIYTHVKDEQVTKAAATFDPLAG